MNYLFSKIPFGPSLYFLLLLSLLVFGVFLSLQPRSRNKGVALTILALYLVGIEISAEDVDLNPTVQRRELIGTWKDGSDLLTLNGNGDYVFSREGKEHCGTWENDDFRLKLHPRLDHLDFYPRVVRAGSEYRIVTNYRDIDS